MEVLFCHCGDKVYYYKEIPDSDGKPFTRNMCRVCSTYRCDLGTYPCANITRKGKFINEIEPDVLKE